MDEEYITEEDIINENLREYIPIFRCGFFDDLAKEAEAFNDLLFQHLPSTVQDCTCDENGWTFKYQDATVIVHDNESDIFSVHAESNTMHRTFLDGMRRQLRLILEDMDEYDLTSTGFAVKLLQLCEEASAWELMWHDELETRSQTSDARSRILTRQKALEQTDGWDARQVEGWESILDNPKGVNISTIEDTAQHLLGDSLTNICSKISDHLRILHVEPVFRNDLVEKFLKRQAGMHHRLRNMSYGALRQSVSPTTIPRGSRNDNIEDLATELARQTVTFHGAPHRAIQSIVRYGFILPGEEIGDTGKALSVRCGSTYGEGIYSSPDPMFASCYLDYNTIHSGSIKQPADVPGMRLIICATLMGRPMIRERTQRNKNTSELLGDYAHSHVSPDQLQYIVFDSAQIIPVYVLHLDYGAERARKEFDRIAQNPNFYFWRRRHALKIDRVETEEPTCPGDVQRKKQALKAAAAKWFPYGYGPAQGTSFVIEEIADVSDDEEAYGDLQEMRLEEESEMRERRKEKGASWFDEFQTVRKTSYGVIVRDN